MHVVCFYFIQVVGPVEEYAVIAVDFVPAEHGRHVFHVGQAADEPCVCAVLHFLEFAFAHLFFLELFEFFPHDAFDFIAIGSGAQVHADGKFGDVLVRAVACTDADGELFFFDEAFVEPAGASVQNSFCNVKCVERAVAYGWGFEYERIKVRSVLAFDNQALFAGLFRVAHGKGREGVARGDRIEVLLDNFHRFERVEVACQHEDCVTRLVILAVMFFGLFAGEVLDVAGPADGRHAVGERFVNHGVERFVKAACRAVVVAHAAFFADHGAFRIEFTQHGVLHAVGFEPHEKFDFVLGECHRVSGQEVARKSVEPGSACGLVGAPEFVLDENLAVFVQHGIVFGSELFHQGGIVRNFCRAD